MCNYKSYGCNGCCHDDDWVTEGRNRTKHVMMCYIIQLLWKAYSARLYSHSNHCFFWTAGGKFEERQSEKVSNICTKKRKNIWACSDTSRLRFLRKHVKRLCLPSCVRVKLFCWTNLHKLHWTVFVNSCCNFPVICLYVEFFQKPFLMTENCLKNKKVIKTTLPCKSILRGTFSPKMTVLS